MNLTQLKFHQTRICLMTKVKLFPIGSRNRYWSPGENPRFECGFSKQAFFFNLRYLAKHQIFFYWEIMMDYNKLRDYRLFTITHTHTHTHARALDRNYTRILRAVLNPSRKRNSIKQQLYSHLPSISQTIKIRRTRHPGHFWRIRDELINEVLRTMLAD